MGIVSTGWPAVRETCGRLGWGFDAWQDGAGRLILAKRADGSYAADHVVISIPRQVGKTYLVACIIFALCLLVPGLKVIWTAHRKTTAAETFRQFDGMAKRPKVAAHIRQVFRSRGDEAIWFNNGSHILFGARESGFGRGMTDVDVLVFDEGQILPSGTLEDMGATQNVAKNPLTFVMGTPPRPKDDGEFFTLIRQEAIDGESEGTLYVEISADRGADPMDRAQWRKANPSFPHRTTERAMLRLRKKLRSDDSWNREALGIWDELSLHLTPDQWDALTDPNAVPSGSLYLAADASPGLTSASVVAYGAGALELVERRPGVAWLTDRLVQLRDRHKPAAVVVDPSGPIGAMVPELEQAGLELADYMAKDSSRAPAALVRAVRESLFRHRGEPEFTAAVAGAKWREVGDGLRLSRKDSTVDITPLVAAATALWAAGVVEDYDPLSNIF